jgi:hypothetical protein
MKFREPTKLRRKSEMWGTRLSCGDRAKALYPSHQLNTRLRVFDSEHSNFNYGWSVLTHLDSMN